MAKSTNNSTSNNPNPYSATLIAGIQNLRNATLSGNFSMEQFMVTTIETVMLMERDEYLAKLKAEGVRDKGNGKYQRAFNTLTRNSIIISVPRTRYTDFKPIALELINYQKEQINELALTLYSKGLTCRDISDILKNFFGEEVSYSQVSNLAEKFHELRLAWENTPLDESYKVVFCDATYISLRREDSYSKEPVHIVYGVRQNNKRELLYLGVNPSESSTSWGSVFERIRSRGVKQIDLIVADGVIGLEDEAFKYFPGVNFQKCVVHKMRNILTQVRPKEKAEMAVDLKELFDNFDSNLTFEDVKPKLDKISSKWKGKYPNLMKGFNYESNNTIEFYFTYLKYPAKIRRMIYTTNSIESLNKKIKKATKNKLSFEKPDRLLDYLFMVLKEFEQENWMKYPVSAFSQWKSQTQSN